MKNALDTHTPDLFVDKEIKSGVIDVIEREKYKKMRY